MRLSVVIPAFNEEATLGACLDRLAVQADAIDEVVVVDNRSTDGTAEVARSRAEQFARFRLISEQRPGVIPARNAGIAAATGDVVARIDADTRVSPGWAASIAAFFSAAGPEFGAAMGPFTQYDMPFQGLHRWFIRRAAQTRGGRNGHGYTEAFSVYGANMAIRKDAWRSIGPLLHDEPKLWEDLDISLALSARRLRSALVHGMRAEVSGRRMLNSPRLYWEFTAASLRTRELHGEKTLASQLGVWVARTSYLVFWVPARTYNPATGNHDVFRLFARRADRPIA